MASTSWASAELVRKRSSVTHAAIEAAREQGNAWDVANDQGELADIYRRMGDVPRAIEEFKATTELYYELGYVGMLPWLKLLARLEIDRGNAERGATLAAIAQRAVEEIGGELPEEFTQVGDPLADALACCRRGLPRALSSAGKRWASRRRSPSSSSPD